MSYPFSFPPLSKKIQTKDQEDSNSNGNKVTFVVVNNPIVDRHMSVVEYTSIYKPYHCNKNKLHCLITLYLN